MGITSGSEQLHNRRPRFRPRPRLPNFAHVERRVRWRVPHIGRVVIEDDVDIGDNTVINRGCLGDTIIRRGAKIDGHVFIAHNVRHWGGRDDRGGRGYLRLREDRQGRVGRANARVRDGVTVGEGAVIGMGADVVKDVPAGATVIGNPAREK